MSRFLLALAAVSLVALLIFIILHEESRPSKTTPHHTNSHVPVERTQRESLAGREELSSELGGDEGPTKKPNIHDDEPQKIIESASINDALSPIADTFLTDSPDVQGLILAFHKLAEFRFSQNRELTICMHTRLGV